MNYKTLLKMTIAAALLPAMSVSASPVDDSFYPYNESTPNYPGLTPGMTLTADNIGQFSGAIDSEMAAAIAAGDVQIKVGKTTPRYHRLREPDSCLHKNSARHGDESEK